MLKKIYLSPFGYIISLFQNLISIFHKPFMVYGFYNRVQKKFMKYTRISSSSKIMNKKKFDVNDNVWIGHYSLLDASNGLKIGKNVQTGSHISIFSHSSHCSIRLLGDIYLNVDDRIGYIVGEVNIGEYTFIGSGTIIFPNVNIGKGCLIKAGSVVTKSFPDYALISGNPAIQIGVTTQLDEKYFKEKIVQENYFDKEVIENWLNLNKIGSNNANTIS